MTQSTATAWLAADERRWTQMLQGASKASEEMKFPKLFGNAYARPRSRTGAVCVQLRPFAAALGLEDAVNGPPNR